MISPASIGISAAGDGFLHLQIRRRRGDHLEDFALVLHVLRPGLQRQLQQLVFLTASDLIVMIPCLVNWNATAPLLARLPPLLSRMLEGRARCVRGCWSGLDHSATPPGP